MRLVSAAITQCLGAERLQRDVVLSSRIKTRATAGDKVSRGMQLSNMQDYAGIRFDIDSSHTELLEIAELLKSAISSENVKVEIKNYLDSPQQGYRAVHVWIRSKSAGR